MGLPKDCKVDLQNKFPKGKRNLISDVPGVKVGHVTLKDDEKFIHTGVTAILPHEGNLFQEKVAAGACVINGFGKSAGLVQIEELGTIETPILMTNTLSVGAGLNGLIQYMLKDNEDIGVSTGTVNCVVTECNDGELNDIRGMHVKEEHVLKALEKADEEFTEGGVGGGTGMCCMGLKGGIGSASRIITCNEKEYTLGAIVMSNFGVLGNLRIDGKRIKTELPKEDKPEKGSIIIVLGTDIPLSDRQLKRIAKRATVGLARVGSFLGNGSGDIAIAFSNGNRIPHYSKEDVLETKMFHDNAMDKLFDATAEVVEEAVISSMYHAETTKGIRNKVLYGLREFI
ncbi:P1 family peptidase [Anaerovoracaceae bacterium 41-7]|jgi:D-aminopeptidase|uniref:S58 family peptidase n=1 Tax=Anaerotruncus colihominis TaxID=169435 RepID=A0A845QHM0_9FIRM|nr:MULTISPECIES: P1 family peptidase [Clostridia]MCI9475957.1 P1 family peptidase [Emergencia sp.]MCI9640661.1 P1 family peptidase [Emergencia sp.]NBH61630.1 S58 family peptidase [Anaerotruncus colihominis]NCF00477.1 S58 family peptidase [Emergencia sp. 1XD21-10]NCF02285.1 S58 family peptidase [Anaerotruncus sp. 80]